MNITEIPPPKLLSDIHTIIYEFYKLVSADIIIINYIHNQDYPNKANINLNYEPLEIKYISNLKWLQFILIENNYTGGSPLKPDFLGA